MAIRKSPQLNRRRVNVARGGGTRVLKLAQTRSVIRSREIASLGIHTGTLSRLAKAGKLEKIGPGRYRLSNDQIPTEQRDLVVAAGAIPTAVICLLSALRFHDIGTQTPHQVWIAIPRGMRVPPLTTPPLRVVHIASALFNLGLEQYRIDRQPIRVYGLARTVADCFRFRNVIGLDVALEALSESWRSKRLNLDELARIAKHLRIQRVMQPYLETIVL